MSSVEAPVATDLATVAHQIPGRVRLQIDSMRHDPVRSAELEQRLIDLPGIDYVRANPKTGSLVVEYDPELSGSLNVLGAIAEAIGLTISENDLDIRANVPEYINAEEAAERVRALVREANARVAHAAGGMDLRIVVPGALFCLGVGVFLGSRRRRMPAWHDLIWYAFNTFQMLNPPQTEHNGEHDSEGEFTET
jgi:hypothetical protein